MPKPRIPNSRRYNLAHKQRIEQYVALIRKIYDIMAREGARLALLSGHEPGLPFSFDDYPMTKEAFRKLLDRMKAELTATLLASTSEEWKQSNLVQDLVANKVLSAYVGKDRNGNEFSRYYQTNPDALKAFQERRIAGMNLSTRVWNLSEQFKPELEMAISSAIAPGMSAQNLSVELKKYLNEPDLMFRRFRYKDEEGCWQRKWKKRYIDGEGNVRFEDCDKDSYRSKWTGRGYYKSSAKNAMRLARTEINMAYRTAEQERWKQFDFVVGYEVHTTQNGSHDFRSPEEKEPDYQYRPARLANLAKVHKPDICDTLAGRYPKDFHFTGWHPQCLCYAVPILKTEDEFWNYDEDDPTPSVNEVEDVPEAFKDWISDNRGRIDKAQKEGKTLPYFLTDNEQYVREAVRKSNPTDLSPHYGNAMKLGRAAKNEAIELYQDSKPPELTPEQSKQIKDFAKELEIEVAPMNFIEADTGHSNIIQDLNNCQSCVISHEARLRGLNVTAVKYDSIPSSATYQLGDRFQDAFISAKSGKIVEPTIIKGDNPNEITAKLLKNTSAKGRYTIGYNSKLQGHVFVAERLDNGKIVFYDPQNNQFININEYAKDATYFEVLKVDKLLFNPVFFTKIISRV